MHELGIIVHITKTLQSVARENNLKEIASVTLEVGEVSSIVPDYLTDCWEYYRKTYPTVEYGRQCPCCGSWETYLLTGDECNIREIEAQ